MKLFEKIETTTKSNGVVVTKFKPNIEVYIKSINLKTGDVSDKLITEYSKHENIKMYKVHDLKNRFKDFHVSEDHSLIVFESTTQTYKKLSPTIILLNPHIYLLVQSKNKNKKMIPVTEVIIESDLTQTIGYDFTVMDNYTFCTDDGVFVQDTMALYAPITKEAIEETKEKLVTSHSTKSLRGVSETFIKELPAGIYFLTMDLPQVIVPITIRDESDFEKLDPRTRIKYDGVVTTIGRVLFNRIMPKRYPYINEPVDKKKLIKLGIEIFNKYEYEIYNQWCSDVVSLCAKYYTLSGLTFSLDDLELNAHLLKLKEKLSQTTDVNEADKILKTIDVDLKDYLIKNGSSLGIFSASGADKGILQVRQILVAKGLIADSNGNPLNPISASIGDGLNSREYFYSGIGSRSGIVDRVINTSETGYLSRQLVYALQRVELSDRVKDCRTKRQVKLKINEDLSKKLEGRYVIRESGKLDLFDPKKDLGEVIRLRSPLYCTSEKICYHCYGDLAAKNRTDYIGILAGHILGEPLSQSIMRSFHTGGSVSMFTMKVVDELSKAMPDEDIKKLSKILEQKDANVISKIDGTIKLDLKDYLNPKKDVLIDSKMISLNYGYFTIKTSAMDIDVILDTKVNIPLEGKEVIQKDSVFVINFKSNSQIFSVIPTSTSFLNKIKILISLLSGKQPWKNPDHFLMKVYNFFVDTNFVGDMIHVEVLVSNLLRDRGNPSYPARLNSNYNAMVGNLKNIPALESWLQSLNFENLNKSITTGLVYNRPDSETLFEKIVTGNL